ncbi:MAG: TIGR02921 family PEP-CTERM protein [Chloroflexi bacterium]|nr:TIGR02921 family PEP-CTERM protein [Chloroflexota bacterium]
MRKVLTVISPRVLGYGLFWSWNIIFVAFMVLGFAPQVLPDLITAVQLGTIPIQFLVFGITLTLIPIVAVILGATRLRRSPGGLVILWYAVQAPLMFMLALRFFLFRDLTPAVAFLMTIATLGMATLLWQILDQNIDARGAVLTHVRVIGLTLLLVIDLYGSLWVAFYTVPVIGESWNILGQILRGIWEALVRFDWRDLLRMGWAAPFAFLGTLLFAYTATLFVGAPIAVPIIAVYAWQRGVRALVARTNALRASALAAVVVVACALIFAQTTQQPQRAVFALLKIAPTNPNEARAMLDQQDAIRAGLLNTYLAQFRYISAVGEVQHIRDLYTSMLKLSPPQTASVEQAYESVARPFLYEPVNPPATDNRVDGRALREEPAQAAKLYRDFFDERIIDGEHDTIANAVRSTWSRTQAEAALQAVDDREILLTRQEITITENNDWADVELYEVYQNQTDMRQEVVYYFSLPESAVVTGVWLGNGTNRATRFAYRVAPRGAAQAVYRNEVRRNMDPALVEQIGPRQYRLRVFPIEPRRWTRERGAMSSTITDGPAMHMWLTYRVLVRENTWALPHLAEKRNVYWDARTTRLVNGMPMNADGETWLPVSIAATPPIKATIHRVDFANGETVIARPVAASELPKLPPTLKLAIVLDRSRSMQKHAAEVKTTLARLAQISGAAMDVYLTSSQYRGETPTRISLRELDVNSITYIGGQNAGELLAQYEQLRAGNAYDAILVITDGSGYELGEPTVKIAVPNAPVWMLHLGGELPLGYDDATLEAIQASGGGAAGDIEDALARIAVGLGRNLVASLGDAPANATADWVDGYAWFTVPARANNSSTAPDGFATFAARRVILDTMYRERASLKQLKTLDHLHALAMQNSIVTPYSSMIVLVNAQQEQLLKKLEQQGDRFDREVEEVGETVPQAASITAVPEPHEWLLLALAAAMLGWYAYKRRGQWAVSSGAVNSSERLL